MFGYLGPKFEILQNLSVRLKFAWRGPAFSATAQVTLATLMSSFSQSYTSCAWSSAELAVRTFVTMWQSTIACSVTVAVFSRR